MREKNFPVDTANESRCAELELEPSKKPMKKLIILVPVLAIFATALTSCTTVVKEPATTSTTTTHETTAVSRPAATQTTTTHTTGGY